MENTENESRQSTIGSTDSTHERNVCDAIGCGKEFRTTELLQRHKKEKCGKNKMKCPFCDKSYQLNIALTNHIRVQHKGTNVGNSQP